MDLEKEVRLPAVVRGNRVLNARDVATEGDPQMVLVPPFPPKVIQRIEDAQAEIAAYDEAHVRWLALARTAADPKLVIRVIGQGELDAEQAAVEIRQRSPLGKYLARLQQRATLITLRAYREFGLQRK